jgi:GntR family transcriptional regulator
VADPPKYKLIAERLRAQIESGELKGGAQLPTELELRDEYGASRNTVRDAVTSLVNQGLVERTPGRGTFVKQRTPPFVITLTQDPETGFGGGEGQAYEREIRAQQRTPSVSRPRVEIQEASRELAAALALEPEAEVICRHQQRYIDALPWSLQTTFYPRQLASRGATRLERPTDVEEGTVRYLQETLGIEQAGYVDRLRVRPVNQSEEKFFELRAASQRSVLESRRVTYDGNGAPVRLTVSVFHPDRAEIAIYEGAVPDTARGGHQWGEQ